MRKFNGESIPEYIKILKEEKGIWLLGKDRSILEILLNFNVCIKGVIVSDEYYQQGEFYGFPVVKYSDWKSLKKETLVVTFNIKKHETFFKRILKSDKVEKVYIFNGTGMLLLSDFETENQKVFYIDNYFIGLMQRALTKDYYEKNIKAFEQTYNWLEDDLSKKIFENYLSGHIELKNFPMRSTWSKELMKNQYFPQDIIHLNKKDEVFVDCGAYTGDTLKDFSDRVLTFKKYYALEPDERRFEELQTIIDSIDGDVVHLRYGVSNENKICAFSTNNDCGEISSEGEVKIRVAKLDDLITEDNISFLKMDIEGAELEALEGAERIIKNAKPTLAICVYHKKEDLITIPQYIKNLEPQYKLYLRSHYLWASEVVLYAIYK